MHDWDASLLWVQFSIAPNACHKNYKHCQKLVTEFPSCGVDGSIGKAALAGPICLITHPCRNHRPSLQQPVVCSVAASFSEKMTPIGCFDLLATLSRGIKHGSFGGVTINLH
jgi:hypothetical protein